jgi:Mg-chelatase subunit ChlD
VTGPGRDQSDGLPAGEPPVLAPQAWLATDERGERRTLDELGPAGSVDPQVRRTARAIARQLSVRWRSTDQRERAGSSGRAVSVPYRYGSDDIDLDRTLEVLTERPVPDDTDIIVRERMRSRRALALVVDVSGSMRGEKVQIAAATVAALAAELVDDELAVIAFWKHAAVVKPIDRARPAAGVLDDLLRVPAKGLTNVGFGLAVALDELGRARARRRSTVLLTDAVHNAGPDPRTVASRVGPLHVLLEVAGEHDADLAADLARLGNGQVHPVRNHRDVAPALNRALAR